MDSDVIIWFLRGKEEIVTLVRRLSADGSLGCSPLSIIEIKLGMKKGEESATNLFLDALELWEIDREIANSAADYILNYRKKGVTLDFVDATIAATCEHRGLTLLTYNTDHYPMWDFKKYKMPDLDV